jgi:hypothetical protein
MGKITRIAEGAPQELVDLAREEMFGDYEHVPARYDYAPSEAAQPAMSLEIVLQRLQDNKINAGLQSFCFCGLTVWIGDPITRKMIEGSLGQNESGWRKEASASGCMTVPCGSIPTVTMRASMELRGDSGDPGLQTFRHCAPSVGGASNRDVGDSLGPQPRVRYQGAARLRNQRGGPDLLS